MKVLFLLLTNGGFCLTGRHPVALVKVQHRTLLSILLHPVPLCCPSGVLPLTLILYPKHADHPITVDAFEVVSISNNHNLTSAISTTE
jgi:hypothetical protein